MTCKRILFIIHDLYQPDVHFPFWAGYLAAMVKQVGVEVSIYDQSVYHYTNDELIQFLDNNAFDIICVSFLAGRYTETAHPLLTLCGKHKKDALLVIGGYCATALPLYMLHDNPSVDVVCLGEAEETIIELVNNQSFDTIKGIVYREGNHIYNNPKRKPISHLDTIPFPAYELFAMPVYTACLRLFGMEHDDRAFGLLCSRGCRGACSFCMRLEKGLRIRSLQNIIEEMKLLNTQYGVNYFMINDEQFVFNKKWIFSFKDALEANDLNNIKFTCDARAEDLCDMEILQCLKDCHCEFVNVGYESVEQCVLDKMNKKTTVEINEQAAENCKKANLPCGLNMLWGSPGDTAESLHKAVSFIKKYNSYSQCRTIKQVTCYPGSPLFTQAIQEDKLKGPADFFSRFKNIDRFTVNFMDMTEEEAYQHLFWANSELIWDHKMHTNMTSQEAHQKIKELAMLYFTNPNFKYRGQRHYSKEGEDKKHA